MESYISRRLPRVTPAELESRARLFSRELAAAGVTAFTDATVRNGPEDVALMARMVSGRAVAQRVAMMLGAPHLNAFDEAARAAQPAGIKLVAVKFVEGPQTDYRPIARWVARARESDSIRPSTAPKSKNWNSRSTRSRPPRVGCRRRWTAARSFVSSTAA